MTEYVIDIVVEDVWYSNSMRHEVDTFYIKIDINGNVDIKRQITQLWTGQPNRIGPIRNMVTINDNIPIPYYIIDMLKNSFCQPDTRCSKLGICSNSSGDRLFLHHYLNAIENIIILKENMAKGTEKIIDLL
jgi:hypothetical protein